MRVFTPSRFYYFLQFRANRDCEIWFCHKKNVGIDQNDESLRSNEFKSEVNMKLKDKVALITGGSRGIGKAVALAYAREGASLAICARTGSELEQTVNEIRALAAECEGWPCDVSLEEPVKELVAQVNHKFGRIDVLVNNAGVMTRPVPTVELEVKKWDYTIAVNLRGPFLTTQAVLPLMLKQRSGSIINVSSSIGRSAYAHFIAYATSKSGLEGFAQTLAAEVSSSNIRVNSVEPGYVATKLTGYHGSKPESITDVFVYLASDESKGTTGKMLSLGLAKKIERPSASLFLSLSLSASQSPGLLSVLSALQMLLEKVQGPVPGFFSGFRIVPLWIRIVVERVRRAGIDLVLKRFPVLLHRLFQLRNLRRDTRVFLAVMAEYRSGNILHVVQIFWVPSVIDHSGSQIFIARRDQQGISPTPAETGYADPVGAHEILLLEIIDRPAQVFSDSLFIELPNSGIRGCTIRKRTGPALSRQEIRCQRRVTGFRQSARHVANVVVEAAVFVNDNDRRAPFVPLGAGQIAANGGPIG
jgi:3-oxoacyl-[acyl-carrier protein] reductase